MRRRGAHTAPRASPPRAPALTSLAPPSPLQAHAAAAAAAAAAAQYEAAAAAALAPRALAGALGRLALSAGAPGEPTPLLHGGALLSPSTDAAVLRRAAAPLPLLKGPSGPRRAGEGVEEEEQAVVAVEKLPNGGLQARRQRRLRAPARPPAPPHP